MVEMNNDLQVGSVVKGTVVKLEEKHVLVDIGFKSEGIVPISELSNLHVESPSDVVTEGEELTLQIKKIDEEEVVLSKKLVDAEAAWDDLQQKLDTSEVFEAEV